MTLVPSTAASAVYHDALSTARRFRTLCFFVLFLVLAGQIALFLTLKFYEPSRDTLLGGGDVSIESVEASPEFETEAEADGTLEAADGAFEVDSTEQRISGDTLQELVYALVYLSLWLGLIFSILLSLSLVFITLVMLNGRTVGVSRAAKAFLWSLLLLLLLVPWQSILNHPTLAGGPFHIPGVLYAWPELMQNIPQFERVEWLGWMRFVVWPGVALLLLLIIWLGSGKGIKQALGEDLPDEDEDHIERPVS